jgi:RimJ/RimL family protein N-acetyltransferase
VGWRNGAMGLRPDPEIFPAMKHSIELEAYGLRFRPVTMRDAEFIVHLRTLPHVLGTVGDTAPDAAEQRRWIGSCFERPNDYYFIIESLHGEAWGTIGLYNFKEKSAEWGRWIILPGIMAALPSAILVHQLAFENFALTELKGEVVSSNTKVLSFHRRFGLAEVGVAHQSRVIQGKPVDMVQFAMSRVQWPLVYQKVHPLAEVAGRLLRGIH